MKNAAARRAAIQPVVFQRAVRMTADAAACRNLCAEHGFAWIHRIGSLLSLSLVLMLRGYVDERVRTQNNRSTVHVQKLPGRDACGSIGFAFFRPIIYQSRPPTVSPRRVRRDKATDEKERRGRIQLETIVPAGRRVTRLFKGRKFSGRGKSIFRTLSTLVLRPRRIHTSPRLGTLREKPW